MPISRNMFYSIINPISHGWGPRRNNYYSIFCIQNMIISFLTLNVLVFWQLLEKKCQIFGGIPPLTPSNEGNHPMTAYDPHFSLQNHFILSKWECLKKNRPKNIHLWTKCEQFCVINIFLRWALKFFKLPILSSILEIFIQMFAWSNSVNIWARKIAFFSNGSEFPGV